MFVKVRTYYLFRISALGVLARAVSTFALALAIAGLVVVAWARPAYAATISVGSTADDATTNGNCTLREAIIAANTDAARDACPAGSGADTITVPAGTYTLTIPEVTPNAPRDATVGDLDITGPTTINGAGVRTTSVDGGSAPFNDRIFENFATTTISGLTVTGGHPRIGDARGGGLRNNANTLTLDKIAVMANTAVYHAGILGQGGTLNVTNSTVSGNSAFETGGGIVQFAGTANITNSTISGNEADDPDDPSCCGVASGVAIEGAGSTMNIESSTIASNTSDSPGGGITTSKDATANVKNTIVSNNTTDNCDTIAYDGGPITSQGNNIDSTNDCRFAQPTDKSSTDPLIGPLANNGGPTDTRPLQSGSPAIDAGDSAAATDQRGSLRPSGAADDIGAFERQSGPPPPGGNSAPAAEDDAYRAKKNQTLSVSQSGILANDSDPDGDALTARLVSGPSKGRLALKADGSFTYKPKRNFRGTDSFVYQVDDGKGGTDQGRVTIKVR